MESRSEVVDRVIARLLGEADAQTDHDSTIPTKLRNLDDLLAGGIRTGQTTLVASRTGEGASTFALGLARAAALHQQQPTLVLAPDAPEPEVVMKLISAETHIALQSLRAGLLDDPEVERVRSSRPRLTSAPLSIVAGGQQRGTIVDAVAAMTDDDTFRVVVGDSAATLGASAREDVAAMSGLARRHHFALVLVTGALHPAGGEVRPPRLTDLRDHDAIADLVDTVLMVEQFHPPEAFVHVVKQRYGPTGSVRVAYQAHTSAFVNLP